MILVTLGTHERPFYRLVKEIERLIRTKKIRERVIIQLGFTDYRVKGAKCYKFIPEEKLNEYIKKCSLLITHGGLGFIMRGIEAGKVVVAVPRRAKWGEHTEDHQLQIVTQAKKYGCVTPVHNINQLYETIKKAKKLRPRKIRKRVPPLFEIIDQKLREWSFSNKKNRFLFWFLIAATLSFYFYLYFVLGRFVVI